MDSATSYVKNGQELMEGGRFSGTKSSKVSTLVFVSGESVCVCVCSDFEQCALLLNS